MRKLMQKIKRFWGRNRPEPLSERDAWFKKQYDDLEEQKKATAREYDQIRKELEQLKQEFLNQSKNHDS